MILSGVVTVTLSIVVLVYGLVTYGPSWRTAGTIAVAVVVFAVGGITALGWDPVFGRIVRFLRRS